MDALFRQILVVAALASMVATEAKVVEVVMATTVAAVQAISIHYQLIILSSTSFNGFFIQPFFQENRVLRRKLFWKKIAWMF